MAVLPDKVFASIIQTNLRVFTVELKLPDKLKIKKVIRLSLGFL